MLFFYELFFINKSTANLPNFIESVCLTYKEEYSLMEDWKKAMMFKFCENWMDAIIKNIKDDK